MSRDQLLHHLTRVIDQLEKEREERNFFQLERDQIYGFWKVAKDEVEDIRARLRYLFTVADTLIRGPLFTYLLTTCYNAWTGTKRKNWRMQKS